MADDIPGAKHLSTRAKRIWKDNTTDQELPHFKQVVYNMVATYCFFICRQPSCEGCNVLGVRSWLSGLKVLPQSFDIPMVRELSPGKLQELESAVGDIEVEKADLEALKTEAVEDVEGEEGESEA